MKLFDPNLTPDEQQLTWYVDRREVLKDFAKRLRWEESVLSRVVLYQGPAGIGKTSVRKMAETNVLKPARVPYVVVDFGPDGSARSAERTFGYMRRQLGRSGLKFPVFDLIWARHWEETTQQRVANHLFPRELKDEAEILALVPLLGNDLQAMPFLDKLGEHADQWISQNLGRRGLAELQEMTASQLLHKMPEALAQDLEEAMQDERYRGEEGHSRITVMFDGYERLEENRVDDWFIREFCQSSGSVLKVIFGREMLGWEKENTAWRDFIDEFPALWNLSPLYANEYLRRRGIADERLQAYFTELTDGLPYYLRLAADLALEIEEKSGKRPAIRDLPGLEDKSHLDESLLSSLLRQMPGEEREAAMVAAVPRWFTEEILELLLPDPTRAARLFQALTHFSFCEFVPDVAGAFRIRKEARQFLRDQVRETEDWLTWNRALRDYHRQFTGDMPHFAEMVYHGLIVEPGETMQLFRDEYYTALNMWQFDRCWTLLLAAPAESELDKSTREWLVLARVALLQECWGSKESIRSAEELIAALLNTELEAGVRGRALKLAALVNGKLGDRATAADQLLEARAIFDSLGETAMKASVLYDLGGLYYALGRFVDALDSYAEALDLVEQFHANGGLKTREGRVSRIEAETPLGGLSLWESAASGFAGLYLRTGRPEKGLYTLRALLDEGMQTNKLRPQATALSELGLAYRRLGLLQKAKSAYLGALDLFQELHLTSSQAHVLTGLGMTCEQGEDLVSAQVFFEESWKLFDEIGDRYGQAKVWHRLGTLKFKAGNYAAAFENYGQALRLYKGIKFIANTGSLLLDLGELHVKWGQFQSVIEVCQEALGVFEGLQDPAGSAAAQVNLGIGYYLNGEREPALAHWLEARSLYETQLGIDDDLSAEPCPQDGTGDALIDVSWIPSLTMYVPAEQSRILSRLNCWIESIRSS